MSYPTISQSNNYHQQPFNNYQQSNTNNISSQYRNHINNTSIHNNNPSNNYQSNHNTSNYNQTNYNQSNHNQPNISYQTGSQPNRSYPIIANPINIHPINHQSNNINPINNNNLINNNNNIRNNQPNNNNINNNNVDNNPISNSTQLNQPNFNEANRNQQINITVSLNQNGLNLLLNQHAQFNHSIPNHNNNINNNNNYQININPANLSKMDGIFASSFKSVKCQNITSFIIVLILLSALLMLYKFKVFKGAAGQQFGYHPEQQQLKFSILPLLIAFQAFILFAKLFVYFNTYSSLKFALQSSNKFGNCSAGQRANIDRSFQQNTSQIYLYAQTSVTYEQGLQPVLKARYQDLTKKKIQRQAKMKVCCIYQLHQLIEFGMFVSSIYLIVALAQDHTTWLQKLILIPTIVYWFLQNFRVIIYTIALLLCPCITIVVLIVVCCCGSKLRNNFVIPEATHPTNQQIINCGGNCSICMMEFDTSNDVIFLPCNEKHMFHELCLKGWLNVKSTCPICRYDLAADRS